MGFRTAGSSFSQAAPLPIKDKIIVRRLRRRPRGGARTGLQGLDAATGRVLWAQVHHPCAGEPGSEDWKGNTNAWETGGGASG